MKMSAVTFPSVWYASEQKINSPSKVIVFDDRGALSISDDSIVFAGGTKHIEINKSTIKNVSLVKQKINWITYLIVNILLIPFLITLDMNFLAILGILIVSNAFGLLVGTGTKWVLVVFSIQEQDAVQAHFADGSFLGWGGILGGTNKIFHRINEMFLKSE